VTATTEADSTRRDVLHRHAGSVFGGVWVAPLLLVLIVASVVPIGYGLVVSLFDWDWGSQFDFVGLANYAAVLADGEFWLSLARTAAFTAMAVSLELVLGMSLALTVQKVTRGVGWLRTVFMVPLMISGIVVALVWKVILDPTLGIIPWALAKLGLHSVDLLGSPQLALPTMSLMDAWWQTGFVFIILSAGLAALPQEYFEAAEVDGASAWQRFRHLTLPLLAPLILIVTAIRSVDCLKVFALVFGTTNGGPFRATETTQFMAYRTAFKEFHMSTSMTMMVIYALLVIAFIGVGYLIRRKVSRAL